MPFIDYVIQCNKSELLSLVRRCESFNAAQKTASKQLTLEAFYNRENLTKSGSSVTSTPEANVPKREEVIL